MEQSSNGDIHITHKGRKYGAYTWTNIHTGGIYSKGIQTGDIHTGHTQGAYTRSEVNIDIRGIHTEQYKHRDIHTRDKHMGHTHGATHQKHTHKGHTYGSYTRSDVPETYTLYRGDIHTERHTQTPYTRSNVHTETYIWNHIHMDHIHIGNIHTGHTLKATYI